MSTLSASRPAPIHASSHRHHPYAPQPISTGASSSSSTSHRHQSSTQPQRKWATKERASPERVNGSLPSPPRSNRDHSASPMAIDPALTKESGKWWDEELPSPPASLSSILDSFRRSGEGDRDLLLAILGAKKAEEERLTTLISTRLTILQARLSVHAASNQLPTPIEPTNFTFPPPQSMIRAPSPGAHNHLSAAGPSDRTPGLTPRGSSSGSSRGPTSPVEVSTYEVVSNGEYDRAVIDRDSSKPRSEHYHLPPPASLWRRHEPSVDLPPLDRSYAMTSRHSDHGRSRPKSREGRSPVSPRSEGHSGLEMLLDAGRHVEV